MKQIVELLQSNKKMFEGIIPDGEIKALINQFSALFIMKKEFLMATQGSILNSALFIAQTGLSPDPRLRELYFELEFNPKTETYDLYPILGLMGTLRMIRRVGDVSVIDAGVIYADQEPTYSIGTNAHFELTKRGVLFGDDEITHFYAFVVMKDGNKLVSVIPVEQVIAKRDSEKEKAKGDKSYYVSHFIAMGKRDVLKECTRYMEVGDVYSQITLLEESKDNYQFDLLTKGVDPSVFELEEVKDLNEEERGKKGEKIAIANKVAKEAMKKNAKNNLKDKK